MELVVSIGIIATAMLLVIGVFMSLFMASEKSVDLTSGTVVAESVLQDYVNRIAYDPAVRENFYRDDCAGLYDSEMLAERGTRHFNQSDFTYSVYLLDAADWGSSGTDPMCKISVVCTWWDSGTGVSGSTRHGYGLLQVELTRLVLFSGSY